MDSNFRGHILERLLSSGEEVIFSKDSKLTEQYAKADFFYFLLEGRVNFYISIEGKGTDLLVGRGAPYTPIGWSGFNEPNRYATTIKVSSKDAKVIKWHRKNLFDVLDKNLELQVEFLWLVSVEARKLIEETGKFLDKTDREFATHSLDPAIEPDTLPSDDSEKLNLLRKSPFFEVFDEELFERILPSLEKKLYVSGQSVFQQGEYKDGLFLLHHGQVEFEYTSKDNSQIPLRTVSNRGFILGWSGVLDQKNLISAIVKSPSEIYYLPQAALKAVFAEDVQFAVKFHSRILWLITNQLQTLRARLVMKKYDKEWLSIQTLIAQNATKLPLDSRLNKIPFLLRNALTLRDAFQMLEAMLIDGSSLEKYLSHVCLEILRETRREQLFYDNLIQVYKEVIKQPAETPNIIVRKQCAEEVIKAFDDTSYCISGWENLPEQGGNIFIYNHLKNHHYNTLPNGFQITLDSHFLSSKVLYQKYGDPGIRIVRIGRGCEHGHQEYYERLGHINVFTAESGTTPLTAEEKHQARQSFYERAGQELELGRNLMISPEGTSFLTEESPGPFKPGAFNLALNIEKEPLIVPIAIANFDRRVRYNTFKCAIMKPFKMSDFLTQQNSKEQMSDFLSHYQLTFKEYVEHAKCMKAGNQLASSEESHDVAALTA